MKNFSTILTFELKNYLKNKTFLVTTILISVIAIVGMFVPRFFDLFGDKKENTAITEEANQSEEDKFDKTVVLYDPQGLINLDIMKEAFPSTEIRSVDSEEEVKDLVTSSEAKSGFAVTSGESFSYYVYNKGLVDSNQETFTQVMQSTARMAYCEANGLDYEEYMAAYNTVIESDLQVLGKDATMNYAYCYGLVIVVFMLIIFYGLMIATSVTNEKSNRSIEVLVTSTSSTSLLFGKVIAGAIASLCQATVVLGSILGSYQINRDVWGGRLDMLFNIPTEVLITFGFFGLGGYLFYAFLYGMVGAMVSKTEDINKTAGSIQMIIMIVYFVVLVQLYNVDGLPIKIMSYLPFSSYSAMFARVAMGKVAIWEIVISYVILLVSIVLVGILAAKVYRNSTLRYGNPLKFKTVFKSLKYKE